MSNAAKDTLYSVMMSLGANQHPTIKRRVEFYGYVLFFSKRFG